MKQIPIIRFSQFDNKWSLIAIGNLAQIKRGASPRPIQDPKWFDKNSDIGWLRISDVTEQNGRIKYLEQKISKLGQEKTRVLNTPHLLLSIAATVGKPVVNYVKTGVHDGFLIFENPKFDREFMFQWFDMFRPKWNKYGQPGSQVNLNSDIIRNHKMMIPSLPEQQSIGSLFRTLDDLLASYKDNLANYRSLKATMFSKMFPKSGQTVPEIRLDGFEDEWKKAKLKDVAHRVQGNDGRMDLPTLTISASGGWMNQIDRFSANIAGKEQKNYTLLKKGELSYNHGNSKLAKYGVVFELKEYEEALVPKVYHSFRVNQLADAKFIEIMFSTKIPDRELGKLVSSGARMDGLLNISFDDFMNIAIIIPTIEEQRVIGTYFSNLDNFINSHQEKISQLETLKKKLLQDMFI